MTLRIRYVASSFLLMSAVLSAVGCGGGDSLKLAPVKGTVTLDGKPVPYAQITFSPQAERGSSSTGLTNAEGRYELYFNRNRRGAIPGSHKVVIQTEKPQPSDDDVPGETTTAADYVVIPKQYRGGAGLNRVVEEKSNVINFLLTTK